MRGVYCTAGTVPVGTVQYTGTGTVRTCTAYQVLYIRYSMTNIQNRLAFRHLIQIIDGRRQTLFFRREPLRSTTRYLVLVHVVSA